MSELIYWIVVMSALAAAAFGGLFLVRAYMAGSSPREMFFKQRAEPRIGVVESANVDGRRRLLLVRRDDVEHLIMTGGPVDVVLETGIGERRSKVAEPPPLGTATVFTRPARSLAVGTPAAPGGSDAAS